MTSYDLRMLARTLVMAAALCVLAYGVMFATDGAMSTAPEKLGRLSMLAPLLGTVGALLADAQARSRGESLALAALGVHPSRARLGALLGAGIFGVLGAILLSVGVGHLEGLFPRLQEARWLPVAEGGWTLPAAGAHVSEHGIPTLGVGESATPLRSLALPRTAIVLSVLWMTAALVDWVRDALTAWSRLVAITVSTLLALVEFHLIAASRLSPWGLLLIPAPLLMHVWGWRLMRGWSRRPQRKK